MGIEYLTKKISPNGDSDVYTFYESDIYKKLMALGELGEMVLPLANVILVFYVIITLTKIIRTYFKPIDGLQ